MRKSVRILIALCLGGSMPAVASAGSLQDGAAAYSRGDYTEALQLLRPVAEQGDALAQVIVGVMYAKGNGVTEDDVEAARWFSLSAA